MAKRRRNVAEGADTTTIQARPAWYRSTWLAALVVVVAVFVFYSHVPGLGWLTWDDRTHVPDNPWINPPSLEGMRQIWTAPYFSHYVPLTYTFWAGEVLLAPTARVGTRYELNPTVFHAGSLLLHVTCACLVFFLLTRLVSQAWAACGGALFFALHPQQVESVAWISETRGTLSTAWMLLALLAHIRLGDEYLATRAEGSKRSWRVGLWYVLAFLAFACAILSKPSAVALPGVAWVLDWAWLKRPWRFSLVALAPWLVPVLAIVWITSDAQLGAARVAENVGLAWRPLIALDALWFYLNKLVVPWPLSPDYGRTPEYVIQSGLIYFTPWIPVLVVFALWYANETQRWVAPVGIFVAALLPVLGLVPFGYQEISTVADRYVYLAMLGPALGVAYWLSRGSLPRYVTAGAVVFGLGCLSFMQSTVWFSDATLFPHALKVNPESFVAMEKIGATHHARQELDEAEQWYRRSLERNPNYYVARNNLGNLYQLREQFDEAAEHYRAILEADAKMVAQGDLSVVRFNLASIDLQSGRLDAAADGYRTILETRPDFTLARINLGIVLAQQGKIAEALEVLRTAVQVDPKSASAHSTLGVALMRTGELAEAQRELELALQLDPHDMQAKEALRAIRAQSGS